MGDPPASFPIRYLPMMPRTRVRRTYLALPARDAFRPRPVPEDTPPLTVRDESGCTVAHWRRLYRDVGDAWHWHDRDVVPDATLESYLNSTDTRILTVYDGIVTVGFTELRRHEAGDVEIVLFGLTPSYMGRGIGPWFLGTAVEAAWAMGATRVWLHTCTLDAPAALPNYLRRGFVVEREEEYETEVP